jgi:membrane protease YdiL (CAAX protease family)
MGFERAPQIVEAVRDYLFARPDYPERRELLGPGRLRDLLYAFLHFCPWLLALSFIEEASSNRQTVLLLAWFALFLFVYARPNASFPTSVKVASPRLRFPAHVAPFAIALWVVAAMGAPWPRLIIMQKCAVIPMAVGSSLSPIFPQVSGITFQHGLLFLLLNGTYPLLEEFYARGWVLTSLSERGVHQGVLGAAAIFSILHLSLYPSLLLLYFGFGVLLGYAVVATGSIWTAVGMHFVYNLTLSTLDTPGWGNAVGRLLGAAGADCRYSWVYVIATVAACVSLLLLAWRSRSRLTDESAPT